MDYRKDFPIFKNKKLFYLDSAATAQRPSVVIDAMSEYYTNYNANSRRGIYAIAEKTTALLDASRKEFANLLSAKPEEIIFTKNTTESLNLLAYALEKAYDAGEFAVKGKNAPKLSKSASKNIAKNIVITEMEHHSNFVTWQQLAKRNNIKLKIARYDSKKEEFEDLAALVDSNTLIVAFTMMSNVTGRIIDAANIIKKIKMKNRDATIILDAAQYVSHGEIDVNKIDADFIAFSAHKLYGPFGVGILYGRKDKLSDLEPFLYGGNMISDVTLIDSQWAGLPDKFEAGTLDIAGIFASAQAVRYIKNIGFEKINDIEEGLKNYALSELRKLPFVKIMGHSVGKYGPLISFHIEDVHPHDLSTICDRRGVCIRSGHHCAQPLVAALGYNALSRLSISFYNVEKDIDELILAIKDAQKVIHGRII